MDKYNGYSIKTETGTYTIYARDSGVEIVRDGHLIFTSRGAGTNQAVDAVHHGLLCYIGFDADNAEPMIVVRNPNESEEENPKEDPHQPCPKCGGEFCGPKVDTASDAKLVNKSPEAWEWVEVWIECDDCGYTSPEPETGATAAWKKWNENR